MFLAVDQGNTFIKATFLHSGEGKVEEVRRVNPSQTEELLHAIERYGVRRVAFSGVGHLDVRLVETLRNVVNGNLLLLTHSTPLPIDISYRSRDTLGLDRVAAAVGAVACGGGKDMIVVDAGTAITADFVDASNTFRGGNISPGLALRSESLHRATAALPLVEVEGECPLFGVDTQTAIRSGVVNGTVYEIRMLFEAARRIYPDLRCVITGGDGIKLYERLKNDIPISLQPNLVALGLLSIYNYNETTL